MQTPKCLTGGPAGTRVTIRSCTGAANQKWTMSSDGTFRIGELCMNTKGKGGFAASQ